MFFVFSLDGDDISVGLPWGLGAAGWLVFVISSLAIHFFVC